MDLPGETASDDPSEVDLPDEGEVTDPTKAISVGPVEIDSELTSSAAVDNYEALCTLHKPSPSSKFEPEGFVSSARFYNETEIHFRSGRTNEQLRFTEYTNCVIREFVVKAPDEAVRFRHLVNLWFEPLVSDLETAKLKAADAELLKRTPTDPDAASLQSSCALRASAAVRFLRVVLKTGNIHFSDQQDPGALMVSGKPGAAKITANVKGMEWTDVEMLERIRLLYHPYVPEGLSALLKGIGVDRDKVEKKTLPNKMVEFLKNYEVPFVDQHLLVHEGVHIVLWQEFPNILSRREAGNADPAKSDNTFRKDTIWEKFQAYLTTGVFWLLATGGKPGGGFYPQTWTLDEMEKDPENFQQQLWTSMKDANASKVKDHFDLLGDNSWSPLTYTPD